MAVTFNEEKELYWLLISEFRYAVARDNHLAPGTCVELIKKYLPKMETEFQEHLANQLMEEIISERIWKLPILNAEYYIDKPPFLSTTDNVRQLEYDYEWENLMVFLLDYITKLPYNWDQYDKFIKSHIVYSDGIEFKSQLIQDKINKNIIERNNKLN